MVFKKSFTLLVATATAPFFAFVLIICEQNCRRILFKNVTILPKGQSPKLKGTICNVPIDVNSLANVLPRGAHSSGIIMIKLKRKLVYRVHEYFEAVSPELVRYALPYLKANNTLYFTNIY